MNQWFSTGEKMLGFFEGFQPVCFLVHRFYILLGIFRYRTNGSLPEKCMVVNWRMIKMSLMIRKPRNMLTLFDELTRSTSSLSEKTFVASTDVTLSEDEYTIKMDLPGFLKEEISITVEENVVNVEAEKAKTEEKENDEGYKFIRRERFASKIGRRLKLRKLVNSAEAKVDYTNGVLTIVLPIAEENKPVKLTL